MQKKSIMHRDIKPDNILQAKTKKSEYRVADFGFAIKLNAYSQRNIAGTMEYVSPKLAPKFKDHKRSVPGHTYKDDVFSFGMTLGEFMTLESCSSINSKKLT
jgi:serine/threonine protein kinase